MGSILGDIYDSEKDKLHKRDKESVVMTRKFDIGDRVWNVRFGWGTVDDYNANRCCPVGVAFDYNNNYIWFTENGAELPSDIAVSLFFEELTIPETALKKPRWRAGKGGSYYFIDSFGDVVLDDDIGYAADSRRFKAGNYFKTEEDAKASAIYKGFHEEL